jgi:DUF1009 family protein
VKLISFEEETDPALIATFAPADHRAVPVGKLGTLLDSLSELREAGAVMAGQVTPRKLFSGMVPDLKLVALMASLKARNAETIFGAISAEIEKMGVRMLDARVFLDDHLATKGCMTGWSCGIADEQLAFGTGMAREMARLDVGQAVVTAKGTVIAVEAFEGTDNMLRRCAQTGGKEMLLTKSSKHAQDWRFDVPCFGLKTLESMAEGGVSKAALEIDGVILIDKPAVLARAKELGIDVAPVALAWRTSLQQRPDLSRTAQQRLLHPERRKIGLDQSQTMGWVMIRSYGVEYEAGGEPIGRRRERGEVGAPWRR